MSKAPGWLQNWLDRHRSPLSFWLHVAGIPLTVAALVVVGIQAHHQHWDFWFIPPALFVIGYGLQYIGHVHEGNDMGEVIVVKRWLRRPYVAISPRYRHIESGERPRVPTA